MLDSEKYDTDKLEEVALAILGLTAFQDEARATRGWKGLDWDLLDRLCERGWIFDPKGKAKSIVFTDEGTEAMQLFFRSTSRGRRDVALPPLVRRLTEVQLDRWCDARVPAHVRNEIQITYVFRGNAVTIFERRPAFRRPGEWTESRVAQCRYIPDEALWSLYCCDRSGRWHRYEPAESAHDLNALLEEIDADPTGIFWG